MSFAADLWSELVAGFPGTIEMARITVCEEVAGGGAWPISVSDPLRRFAFCGS